VTAQRPLFENLNGLRFFAAIAVIIFHSVSLNREIWGSFYESYAFQKIAFLTSKGHLGIIFFFVLSGFLITYLLLWENKNKGKINFIYYLVRRFLRVWPLYFLIIFFGFFIFPKLPYGIETVHELWRFLIFCSNFDEIIVGVGDPINFLSATWTVSVEEQFYFVWGILIGLFNFNKKETYYFFFSAIIVTSLVFRYLNIEDHRMLYFHTLSVMSDLAFGGIIGLYAFSGKAKRFFEKLSKSQIITVYVVTGIIFLFESHIFGDWRFIFERFAPGLIFSFVILEQIYAKNSFYKADKIKGFFFSGKLTYGFYMFHCIYIYYWAIFFENNGYVNELYQFVLYTIVILISTYITAYLSYRFYEAPILRLKRHFR